MRRRQAGPRGCAGCSRRGAVRPLDRGDRAHSTTSPPRRCCGCCAVALPADLGAGVPVAAAVAAQVDADGAAGGHRRHPGVARGRRRAGPAAHLGAHQSASSSSPWPAMASWRGPGLASHLTEFYVALSFGGMWADCSPGWSRPSVLVDRGVPDPAGAGGAVPPAGTTPCAARPRSGSSWRRRPCPHRHFVLERADGAIDRDQPPAGGQGVCGRADGARRAVEVDRWKLAALVTLVLVLIRVYPADEGRVENRSAASSASTRSW